MKFYALVLDNVDKSNKYTSVVNADFFLTQGLSGSDRYQELEAESLEAAREIALTLPSVGRVREDNCIIGLQSDWYKSGIPTFKDQSCFAYEWYPKEC